MLNEDTKLEVELSGEIDSSAAPAAVQEGVGKKSMFGGGMSLPVPISLSQPAVKEWFGRRKANVRPFGVFFNTSNFQVDMITTSTSISLLLTILLMILVIASRCPHPPGG